MTPRDEAETIILAGFGGFALAVIAGTALSTWRHSRARKQILARGRQVTR